MVKATKNLKYYEAVGRRKNAVARVRLYIVSKDKTATVDGAKLKKGEIRVNDKSIETYFPTISQQKRYMMPLERTNTADRFAISVHIQGGGVNGQIEAVMHGLARALQLTDESLRPLLKEEGFLTRDSRKRQRRKVGTGGKARRAKQSPKR